MTCMEAQTLITPFINDKLELNKAEQFINHVQTCKDCMEELEVYFAILTAMKQLDEDEEVATNFNQELKKKIEATQEKIFHNRLLHIRKRILFICIVCMIGFLTSFSMNVVEEVFTLSKEQKFNKFAFQNVVMKQYSDDVLIDNLVDYSMVEQQLKIKHELLQLEEVRKEQFEHERKIREAIAKEAYYENYRYNILYQRQYEEAKSLMSKDHVKKILENKLKQQRKDTGKVIEYSH